MKILQINKYFYLRGGVERYLFELTELLERHGHTVIPFSMEDKKNFPSPWSRHFVRPVQTERVRFGLGGLRTVSKFLYSKEAKRNLASLIAASQPQVAHLHGAYHQLSSSVLDALREKKIPTVMTVHDFHLLSPNYALFHDGAVCLRGIKHPLGIISHRCVKGSVAASSVSAMEAMLTRFRKTYEKTVTRFLAPSQFVIDMFERYGFDTKRFVHVPLFIDARKYRPAETVGDAVTYVGRLSPEKGIMTLLLVARDLPDVKFRIIGTGPELGRLRSFAAQANLSNVEFVGFLDGEPLHETIRAASVVVLPSLSFETFGLAALEAMALGKPVLASRVGAYPEIVRDGTDGRLVAPGSHEELRSRLQAMLADTVGLARMGEAGRARAVADFSPDRHYARLVEIYQDALMK